MPASARKPLIEPAPPHTPYPAAGTFIVRVWLEALSEEQTGWRGRVQDVSNGKVAFFRDWEGLEKTILEMLTGETSGARVE